MRAHPGMKDATLQSFTIPVQRNSGPFCLMAVPPSVPSDANNGKASGK
jgi:hypothetical protein